MLCFEKIPVSRFTWSVTWFEPEPFWRSIQLLVLPLLNCVTLGKIAWNPCTSFSCITWDNMSQRRNMSSEEISAYISQTLMGNPQDSNQHYWCYFIHNFLSRFSEITEILICHISKMLQLIRKIVTFLECSLPIKHPAKLLHNHIELHHHEHSEFPFYSWEDESLERWILPTL